MSRACICIWYFVRGSESSCGNAMCPKSWEAPDLWEVYSFDHLTLSFLVLILRELSLAHKIFCIYGISLRSSLRADSQLNSTLIHSSQISNNLNFSYHSFCTLMRDNSKGNDLVLQLWFYVHTQDSKFTRTVLDTW